MKPDNWNRFAAGLLAILLCLCSFSMQSVSTTGWTHPSIPLVMWPGGVRAGNWPS